MSERDVGIRGTSTFIGVRTPDEIKEDENTKRYVETVLNQTTHVSPEVDPLGDILARTTPSLNLEVKPKEETKEAKEKTYGSSNYWKNKKELTDYLSRPTRAKAKPMKVTDYVDKMNHLYSNEPKNEKTVQQLKALKEWSQPKPVGLGDNYKSDIRTPVQKKRDSYNAKVDANRTKTEEAKKGGYTPWYERMAAEEAEALNKTKRMSWEQGGKVNPEPKYVNAQDVKNVYEPKQPEATPLQMKQLHKRLQNHNERTGEFKNLPKEEKPTHTPRFLHNPATNELEDTYDPNWGDDILNDKK